MNFLIKTQAKSTFLAELLTIVGGAFLLFAASQIEIPLNPVPITLQTVAVMLIGLTYSPRRAIETHLLWLGMCAVGLPVLSGFVGGIAYFVRPTGGYLLGFVIASFAMATLKEKFSLNSWKSDALLTILGTVIVFASGVLWLSYCIGWPAAFYGGVLPFILPGIVKGALLCSALQIVRYARQK